MDTYEFFGMDFLMVFGTTISLEIIKEVYCPAIGGMRRMFQLKDLKTSVLGMVDEFSSGDYWARGIVASVRKKNKSRMEAIQTILSVLLDKNN